MFAVAIVQWRRLHVERDELRQGLQRIPVDALPAMGSIDTESRQCGAQVVTGFDSGRRGARLRPMSGAPTKGVILAAGIGNPFVTTDTAGSV